MSNLPLTSGVRLEPSRVKHSPGTSVGPYTPHWCTEPLALLQNPFFGRCKVFRRLWQCYFPPSVLLSASRAIRWLLLPPSRENVPKTPQEVPDGGTHDGVDWFHPRCYWVGASMCQRS